MNVWSSSEDGDAWPIHNTIYLPKSFDMFLIQTFFTLAALIWLLHRAWQIFNKPLPELVKVLGLDIPPAPRVSLAGIRSDQIQLQWPAPENPSHVSKYFIQVNGVIVGSTPRNETVIFVTGLESDHLYNVRIIATNSSTFNASSNLIRLRTKPSAIPSQARHDLVAGAGPEGAVSTARDNAEEIPRIRLQGPTVEPVTPTAPVMTREHSGSLSHGKRQTPARRTLPGNTNLEPGNALPDNFIHAELPIEFVEVEGTVDELNRHLEGLQREVDDVHVQTRKEDEDFNATRDDLSYQNDKLRQSIHDKETGSAELRKEWQKLDRKCKAVQKEKREIDQELQHKQVEREKMQQDIKRWDKDIADNKKKSKRTEKERRKVTDDIEKRISETKKQIAEDQKAILALEEEVKSRGIQIRDLEGERKRLGSSSEDGDTGDRDRIEREKDAQWTIRQGELRQRYASMSSAHEQANSNFKQAQAHLAYIQSQLALQSQLAVPSMPPEYDPSKKVKHRRSRQRKSRSNTGSSNEKVNSMPGAFSSLSTGVSTSFASSTPYFNMSNGMALAAEPEQFMTANKERDSLIAGAPMSPSANGYLPSDLLGDDEMPVLGHGKLNLAQNSVDVTRRSFGILPPLTTDSQYEDPNSPHSSGSRSRPPSLFSSPRTSLNNIPSHFNNSESYTDSDRRSLNSNHPSLGAIDETTDANPAGSRKLTSLLFPFGSRQRDKIVAEDGLAFGSLKSGQSQSFPRNLHSMTGGQDPIGTRARSGSHNASGGGWRGQFGSLLSRNVPNVSDSIEGNAPAAARMPASRRNRYDPFRSDSDPLEPSAFFNNGLGSPRPASVSSRGEGLPRPSTDSQTRFGWPYEGPPNKNPLYGSEWPTNQDPWSSRNPSRRESLHRGSASSSSLGRSSLGQTNADTDSLDMTSPPAPIGTKPKSFAQRAKLNPNAPAFSLNPFNRNDSKKAEKAETAEKKKKEKKESKSAKEKEKEAKKDKEREHITFPPAMDESPPSTRRSRDSRSINTEISQSESHDSLERSTSGTPSESVTPSGTTAGKETLIQKLTRKGSSSKFNIGWKDKAGLFGKKSVELDGSGAMVEEGGEGSGDSVFGRSVDSATSSPNVGATDGKGRKGWGMLGRKRRGEKTASEASEKASETETGDDEDD